MVDGYTFWHAGRGRDYERWVCSGNSRRKCRVFVHVNDKLQLLKIAHEHTHKAPLYVKTSSGFEMHSISQRQKIVDGRRLHVFACEKGQTPQSLGLFREQATEVSRLRPRQRRAATAEDSSSAHSRSARLPKYIQLANGTFLLMVNGYTFWHGGKGKDFDRWVCSGNKRKKCRVFVHVSKDLQLLKIANEHTHEAPVINLLYLLESERRTPEPPE
ncbi:hypothetical protein EVAR_9189_1 [Eumeta japonica]|uniref:FLYWCH-type domain-containing protein n=1 Tax=Eumeta variegata TaxID=151549 RepID=A0A4C1WQA8_EUMVA|nr:hypothetical protein EVAR_9189_1 [Eumeta japonica]